MELATMNKKSSTSFRIGLVSLLMTLMAIALPVTAQESDGKYAARAAIMELHAEVLNINYESRELSLKNSAGHIFTLTAGDNVERLNEIAVGDSIVTTFFTSLAAEMREPTAEEMENPWVVLEETVKAGPEELPGAITVRIIRAICTIEGMNRVTRTVMIQDPRGMFHMIGDVKLQRFSELSIGQTVIMTYSEAVALTLVEVTE